MIARLIASLPLLVLPLAAALGSESIHLGGLLDEMLDRDHLARLAAVPYTTGQASSYDRASVAPDRPGWFANIDFGQYLRVESRAGRDEFVMMDVDGPGAITRWWRGDSDPAGVVRVYLDGQDEPAIEENLVELLSGKGPVGEPLAAVRSLGCDLYLPIPYANHCKITFDRLGAHWYNIEYRTYPAGTPVRTFTLAELRDSRAAVDRVQRRLVEPWRMPEGVTAWQPQQTRVLAHGESLTTEITGPAAVRLLSVRIDADKLPEALRATVLIVHCDDERTVWCPVGDFFGSGIGLNPYRDWYRDVDRSGVLSCRWTMPFARSCRIELKNLGDQPIAATLGDIGIGPWTWDERSLHFRANWRQEYPIVTKKAAGTCDWNFIDIRGQGYYVGDTLAMHNGAGPWWGEGDEKIRVDGEAFPSHFGTGTEDYYGYAYGDRGTVFEHPFIALPRAEGENKPGHVTNTRTRSLDLIPFTVSLSFDLEIWHWEATTVAYAAATYWYARPGATCNRGPAEAEASRPLPPGPAAAP